MPTVEGAATLADFGEDPGAAPVALAATHFRAAIKGPDRALKRRQQFGARILSAALLADFTGLPTGRASPRVNFWAQLAPASGDADCSSA